MDYDKDYGKILYESLPAFYRYEDKNTELERFLKIFGEAMKYLHNKIVDYSYLFDVDKTLDLFIPHLLDMLGFKYYKDVSIGLQRKFLKALPYLNAMKGSIPSFEFLVRELSGYSVITYNDPEDRNVVHIRIIVPDDKAIKFAENESAIKRYMEYIRPINTVLIIYIRFIAETSIKIKHDMRFKWRVNIETNPWLNSSDIAYYHFDGKVKFDGSILFNASNKDWRGIRHDVEIKEKG